MTYIADDGDYWFQSEHVSGLNVLCRPYAALEPELSASELMELDALADKVELDRLQAMGVLLPGEPAHVFRVYFSPKEAQHQNGALVARQAHQWSESLAA